MLNQLCFRIILTTLAFCLCLGSQAILPASNAIDLSALEVPGIDLEQAESEEELLTPAVTATIVGLIFLKYGVTNLDFQTAGILPVSPPPKHT
jgi:hypothetical protein